MANHSQGQMQTPQLPPLPRLASEKHKARPSRCKILRPTDYEAFRRQNIVTFFSLQSHKDVAEVFAGYTADNVK